MPSHSYGTDDFSQSTKLSTAIYNQTEAENATTAFDFIDADCGCVGESSKEKCVYINCCLDKKAYEWLQAQDGNHHVTLNRIIAERMGKDTQSCDDNACNNTTNACDNNTRDDAACD